MSAKIIRKLLKESMRNMRVATPAYFKRVTIIDRILAATVLRFIPTWVTPNYVTIFRFAMIPLLIAFLMMDMSLTAAILFVVAAFSDAVDGALARTRNMITEWGIVNDPFADKLLIGSMVAILVSKYIHPFLALSIISLEIIILASALYKTRWSGEKIVPAKKVGKIKMILESVGLTAIFAYALWGSPVLIVIGTWSLYGAIFFALLSLFVYKSI